MCKCSIHQQVILQYSWACDRVASNVKVLRALFVKNSVEWHHNTAKKNFKAEVMAYWEWKRLDEFYMSKYWLDVVSVIVDKTGKSSSELSVVLDLFSLFSLGSGTHSFISKTRQLIHNGCKQAAQSYPLTKYYLSISLHSLSKGGTCLGLLSEGSTVLRKLNSEREHIAVNSATRVFHFGKLFHPTFKGKMASSFSAKGDGATLTS